MKFIDNHAHLNFDAYDADRDLAIARAREAGVGIINVGTDFESSKRAVELAEANTEMWAIVGQHPTDTEEEFDTEKYEELLKSKKVVAIGECGLDYFHLKDGQREKQLEEQKNLFIMQIELSQKYNLPLMLHIRDAYEDALEILRKYPSIRGNSHFFAGNVDIAKQFLDLGFTMSFTGAVTYGNNYEEVIKFLPIESILSETDCPFVAPVPYRGKRNEPAYVVEVVKRIAEIKGVDFEEASVQLLANSKRLFGI